MTMQEWETENVFQMISRLQIDFNFNNKILLLILKLQYNNNHNINIIKIGWSLLTFNWDNDWSNTTILYNFC